MTYSDAELADICDKAADEIIIRGGTKYSMMDIDGKVCINGAIVHAMGNSYRLSPVGAIYEYWPTHDDVSAHRAGPPRLQSSLQDHIKAETGLPKPATFSWNDMLKGTPEEQDSERIELLRQTAKTLREQA